MANINHLEMAGSLSALSQIEIKKSWLGLKTDIIYVPTHSSIRVIQNEYDATNGKALQQLIQSTANDLVEKAAKSDIKKASIGNVRLDACISADNQFAAIQLLHFIDLTYTPIMDMKVFEGEQAEALIKVIKQ